MTNLNLNQIEQSLAIARSINTEAFDNLNQESINQYLEDFESWVSTELETL